MTKVVKTKDSSVPAHLILARKAFLAAEFAMHEVNGLRPKICRFLGPILVLMVMVTTMSWKSVWRDLVIL